MTQSIGDSNNLYWVDKLQNPCGDNYSVSEIEISFSLVSGQSDSATTPPPLQFDSSQCITQTDDICISDASGVAGFASMPSPISVCSLTIDASMYNGSPPMLGVAYTVNVTLTLTRPAGQVYGPQSYTVTEEVGNFVPNAANPRTTPGYFQPAVYTATAVKTANPMRGWYGVPAGAKPTTGSQPQSFVILQPPSFSGSGSYSTADLSQYVTSSSIPTDVVHNTVFLESPVVENISGLQSDVLVVNDEAAQLFDDDEAMPVMTATPCRVTNNPVVCDCGTVVTGGETSLDVQMTTAAAQGGHTVAFHSGYFTAQYAPYSEAMQESQLLLSVFWAILYGNVKPWTLSYSYGYPLGCPDSVEADAAMIEFIEPYFASLGLIGTSVFVASGDQGAHWSCGPPASTINPNVSLNYDPMGGCFAPSGEVTYTSSYPAVSQYVTAVGGSSLQPVGVGAPTLPGAGANTACPGGGQLWPGGDANEGVCVVEQSISIATNGGITSGGGFSAIGGVAWTTLPQPSWQQNAIADYITGQADTFYSTTGIELPTSNSMLGRGYPDMVAFAGNINMVMGGVVVYSGGTSAASPFTAALISLLNSDLRAAGFPQVGFLNPLLYAAAANATAGVFNDVVTGSNACRGQAPPGYGICCPTGFVAATGWDPTSGLGSLNYPNLLAFAKWYSEDSGRGSIPPSTSGWVMPSLQTSGPLCQGQEPPPPASLVCNAGNTNTGSVREKLSAGDDVGIAIAVALVLFGAGLVIVFAWSIHKSNEARRVRGRPVDPSLLLHEYHETDYNL